MAVVREWREVTSGISGPTSDRETTDYTITVPAGATLMRSLIWVSVVSADITLVWPPDTACPVRYGLYQNLNDSGGALSPDIGTDAVDWVATEMLEWKLDAGVFVASEQDCIWHAFGHVDSAARRKVLDDDPVVTFSIAPVPVFPDPGERIRPYSYSFWLRQLWEHTV